MGEFQSSGEESPTDAAETLQNATLIPIADANSAAVGPVNSMKPSGNIDVPSNSNTEVYRIGSNGDFAEVNRVLSKYGIVLSKGGSSPSEDVKVVITKTPA